MALVLDTNLVVLLVAGLVDQRLISAHKRLQDYDRSDHAFLLDFIARSGSLLLLPNVLTESSNLLAQIGEPARQRLLVGLSVLAAQYPERYIQSATAMQQYEYTRLGLTDAAILATLLGGAQLLTSDAGLHVAAVRRGYRSSNFFHERDFANREQ